MEKNEMFFVKTIQSLIKFWNIFSAHDSYKYQAIAYMFEIFLYKYHKEEYDVTNIAYIILNNAYVEKEAIFLDFKNNNFYGYDLLREYSQLFIIMQEE